MDIAIAGVEADGAAALVTIFITIEVAVITIAVVPMPMSILDVAAQFWRGQASLKIERLGMDYPESAASARALDTSDESSTQLYIQNEHDIV